MDPACLMVWVSWIFILRWLQGTSELHHGEELTATPITITKGIKAAQVVATNAMPHLEVLLGTMEKLDEIQGI